MKGLENNHKAGSQLGELAISNTEDMTISLHSYNYKESFHSKTGALKESIEKYINPSELYRYKKGKKLVVLDVCLGLGYNTGSLLENCIKNELSVQWWGLDIDKRPLSIAINHKKFRSCWSKDVLKIFQCLERKNCWRKSIGEGEILWGDARETIAEIPKLIKFDLIFLDAFSPQKCPHLWTEEFLSSLSKRLAFDGRLITYCTASAIRKSLQKVGLKIFSTIPLDKSPLEWSSGTVGIVQSNSKETELRNQFFKPLTKMEAEHLLTKSAIPYRDPKRTASIQEILKTRKNEQIESELESTSSWKKRWSSAEYSFKD